MSKFSLPQLPLDDLERIAGGPGLVHDDRRGRALLGGDLVLVGPAAVVRHRLALEHRRRRAATGRAGSGTAGSFTSMTIVLPAHVDALVVVPAVLRRDDAVADEDDVGTVDARVRLDP